MHSHAVHVHRDRAFLLDSLAEYFRDALRRGEAGIVIARPAFRHEIALRMRGLQLLDAERTLARFMVGGMPHWSRFRRVIGGLIGKAAQDAKGVRAYGEMVDVLWQRGEHDAAIRLEEYWNELAGLQTFSLLCAYHLDSLDDGLQRICAVHTQLIPARDHSVIDRAVAAASEEVLAPPLAGILASIAKNDGAGMPRGHATLLWLRRNMPRAAAQVLARVRSRLAAEAA